MNKVFEQAYLKIKYNIRLYKVKLLNNKIVKTTTNYSVPAELGFNLLDRCCEKKENRISKVIKSKKTIIKTNKTIKYLFLRQTLVSRPRLTSFK